MLIHRINVRRGHTQETSREQEVRGQEAKSLSCVPSLFLLLAKIWEQRDLGGEEFLMQMVLVGKAQCQLDIKMIQ